MPERNQSSKTPELTSLRRSPRLLQLKLSPKTPFPQIRSKIPPKSPINLNDSVSSPMNYEKLSNGFGNDVKLGNGSRRKSNFGDGLIDGSVCRQLKNSGSSSMNYEKVSNGFGNDVKLGNGSRQKSSFGNGLIDGSVCRDLKNSVSSSMNYEKVSNWFGNDVKLGNGSRRKSNFGDGLIDGSDCRDLRKVGLVEIDGVVCSPVTPVGVAGEKFRGSGVLSVGSSERRVTRGFVKKMGGDGKCETIGTVELSMGESERRVTRSFVKKIGGNVGSGGGKCETSGGIVLSLGRSERRVSRGCAKEMGGNVGNEGSAGKCETSGGNGIVLRRSERRVSRGCVKEMSGNVGSKEIVKCGLNERDLFDDCDRVGGSGLRKCVRSARGAIGNNDEESVSRSLVCCLTRVGCDSRFPSNVPGVVKGRCSRKNVKERNTRNAAKRVVNQTDLCARVEGDGVKERESIECVKVDSDKPKNGTKLIGVKRKRKQPSVVKKDQGWTNEQEATLQRAYFTAKPSPHFWKRVSKLVPGKSAQECFDKVHSANLTPLSARHSSRLKKQNSPSACLLSSDELLKPIPTKSKRQFKTKQKSHVARRNVRQLLQKYCRDSEADLFSILEPSGNPSAVHVTPIQSFGSPPSSGHNKRLSRFSGAIGSPLTSPPVLKKVKNMALHEKYIDQLHAREGKRSILAKNDGTQNSAQRKGIIKAAKDALASDARDVIEKFRDSQTNLMEAYSDSEEIPVSDNDEDDMAL